MVRKRSQTEISVSSDADTHSVKKPKQTTKAAAAATSRKTGLRSSKAAPKTATTEKAKRIILVNWSDEKSFYLTDKLLTLIEESSTYRQAFGFERIPDAPANTSQGKKLGHQQNVKRLSTA